MKFHQILSALFLGVLLAPPQAIAQFDLTPPSKSFEEERREIAPQHPMIVKQFGGEVDDPELAAYIERVGQKLVSNSDMAGKPFKFTVLNSPIVNAFTVGGGYLYVTRGILAVMNNEAELAAVMGHEIGHVTGRHTSRRETRMKWKQAESEALALLTGNLFLVGAKQLSDATLNLGYSRGQERAADRLGFKMIKKAGYDPHGLADMLGGLQRYVRLQSAMVGQDLTKQVPAWLQDHPQTDERIRVALVEARFAEVGATGTPKKSRSEYLDAIDGIMYGDDPAQGTVRDGVFYHTGLGLAFNVPERMQLQNKPEAVIGTLGQEAVMMFGAMPWAADKSLQEYASHVWDDVTHGKIGQIDSLEETEINGMNGLIANKSISGRQPLRIQTAIYRFNDETVAHMSFLTTTSAAISNKATIEDMALSFRRLTDQEAGSVKSRRLHVVTVGPKDDLGTLSERMEFDTYRLGRMKMLNNLETGDSLKTLDRVKLVVFDE